MFISEVSFGMRFARLSGMMTEAEIETSCGCILCGGSVDADVLAEIVELLRAVAAGEEDAGELRAECAELAERLS